MAPTTVSPATTSSSASAAYKIQCYRCGKYKAATTDHFSAKNLEASTRNLQASAKNPNAYEKKKEASQVPCRLCSGEPITERVCFDCDKTKLLSEYSHNQRRSDHPKCTSCVQKIGALEPTAAALSDNETESDDSEDSDSDGSIVISMASTTLGSTYASNAPSSFGGGGGGVALSRHSNATSRQIPPLASRASTASTMVPSRTTRSVHAVRPGRIVDGRYEPGGAVSNSSTSTQSSKRASTPAAAPPSRSAWGKPPKSTAKNRAQHTGLTDDEDEDEDDDDY